MTTPMPLRVLVVTLMYRQLGQAWASWAVAMRHWLDTQPGAQFEHIKMYGGAGKDGHEIILNKYQQAQRLFLAGDWDVMICLEDDIIIPPDAFTRLLRVIESGADVAYGLYCWRQTEPKWSAYLALTEERGVSMSYEPELARDFFGQVLDVAGCGLGCTAIRRRVLMDVSFRRGGEADCDWYFAHDANVNNFIQRCDTGLVCGHLSLFPSPRILYPDVREPELYRVDFLP